MYYYGPMTDGNDWSWGMLMMGIWFLFLVITAIVVVRLLRGHEFSGPPSKAKPLDIAKERYAKGELTKEQFEQIKKDLQ